MQQDYCFIYKYKGFSLITQKKQSRLDANPQPRLLGNGLIHPFWTHRWHRQSQPMHGGAHRPFRAWRIAGKGSSRSEKAEVMLTFHLAQACHIPETVAHRIIRYFYGWQGVDTLARIHPLWSQRPFE